MSRIEQRQAENIVKGQVLIFGRYTPKWVVETVEPCGKKSVILWCKTEDSPPTVSPTCFTYRKTTWLNIEVTT